jgi:hypothetical protein
MNFQDTYGQTLNEGDKVTFLYRKKRYYGKVKGIRATTIVALLDVVDDNGKRRTVENNRQRSTETFSFPVQKIQATEERRS